MYAEYLRFRSSEHGTCYSTLRAECNLPQQGLSREDTVVLNYFRELMLQWRVRPTYQWLAAAGIVPDANKTYKLTDLQAALKKASGGVPYLGCPKGMNTVNEVWYYHFVQVSWLSKSKTSAQGHLLNFGKMNRARSFTDTTPRPTLARSTLRALRTCSTFPRCEPLAPPCIISSVL